MNKNQKAVGERFMLCMKRELLKVQKEGAKLPKDNGRIQWAIDFILKPTLGNLHKKVTEVSVEYSKVHGKLNGREIAVTHSRNFPASVGRVDRDKALNCKKQAHYTNMLNSRNINKFKAFARAKYDTMKKIEALSEREFQITIKEFCHSLSPAVCKL